MIEKNGILTEDSVGDMFTTKKATHIEKDGFLVVNKEDIKDNNLEKQAFEEIKKD